MDVESAQPALVGDELLLEGEGASTKGSTGIPGRERGDRSHGISRCDGNRRHKWSYRPDRFRWPHRNSRYKRRYRSNGISRCDGSGRHYGISRITRHGGADRSDGCRGRGGRDGTSGAVRNSWSGGIDWTSRPKWRCGSDGRSRQDGCNRPVRTIGR